MAQNNDNVLRAPGCRIDRHKGAKDRGYFGSRGNVALADKLHMSEHVVEDDDEAVRNIELGLRTRRGRDLKRDGTQV